LRNGRFLDDDPPQPPALLTPPKFAFANRALADESDPQIDGVERQPALRATHLPKLALLIHKTPFV